MPLVCHWRGATHAPVDGSAIRPDQIQGSIVDAARVPVRVGNLTATLGDLFRFEGDGSDGGIVLDGDLRSVHGLGSAMTGGRLEVVGDVGHRLGVGLVGGEIVVRGSVGGWAGAEMLGGLIRVEEDAGDDLGAALPGSRAGMRGGVILVGGNAGSGVGLALRRGTIAVAGSAGAGAGRGLVAGTIFVGGEVGPGLGSGMKRGTIAIWNEANRDFDPGPTFEPSGSLRPPVVAIYLKQLRDWGFPVAAGIGSFRRYNGDRATGGHGEIWELGRSG